MTAKDEDNLVICELCKKKFHIEKTVALLTDPKKTDFFYRMGIDSVVCAITAITGIIEQQAFVDKITTLIPIGEGRVNIAEVPIPDTSPAAGKKLWEINLPKEVIVGCILRGDTTMVPRGDTRILSGDMLVLISSDKQEMAHWHTYCSSPGYRSFLSSGCRLYSSLPPSLTWFHNTWKYIVFHEKKGGIHIRVAFFHAAQQPDRPVCMGLGSSCGGRSFCTGRTAHLCSGTV